MLTVLEKLPRPKSLPLRHAGLAVCMILSVLLFSSKPAPVMAMASGASQAGSVVNAGGDAFEEDDVCASAHAITINDAAQAHNLFRQDGVDDADWVKFEVAQ